MCGGGADERVGEVKTLDGWGGAWLISDSTVTGGDIVLIIERRLEEDALVFASVVVYIGPFSFIARI